MITTSLRRVARPRPSPQPTTRHSTPAFAASFFSRSHQRRHSSSKPPIPPNNGTTNVTSPTVKAVDASRSKDGAGEKRTAVHAKPSRRRIPRDKMVQASEKREEWALSLPSVPSTQHLDPKDIYVASFFSNHRPMSVTSSVPLSTPEDVFQSLFAPAKPHSKSKPGTAEVIYTLASTVQALDTTITQNQNKHQPPNQQQAQHDRSDLLSILTQGQNAIASDPSDSHHLDGPPQPNTAVQVPNGLKLAMQQIARQFRPFNTPPVPQPISDAQIEAKRAEDAAATEADELQARELEIQIEQQDSDPSTPGKPQHFVINVHERMRDRHTSRFFTPHTTNIDSPRNAEHHSLLQRQKEIISRVRQAPQTTYQEYDIVDSLQQQNHDQDHDQIQEHEHNPNNHPRPTRIRSPQGTPTPYGKSVPLRRRKMYAISVRRQRKNKMKKHKRRKFLRSTRDLRRKLGK